MRRLFIYTIIAFYIIVIILLSFASINAKADIKIKTINIYDINTNLIYSQTNDLAITWIPLEHINKRIIDAFITIEDQQFFQHNGFNFTRIIQSAITNIGNSTVAGASTISQQLARMLYLNNEQTLKRKLIELNYTLTLENNYSKEKILETYLNTLYFGHNIYGIYQASQFFFAKSPQALSISEIAMLVGIIKGPAIYSPLANEKKAIERRNIVLKALYNANTINRDEFEKAFNEPLIINNEPQKTSSAMNFYIDYVLNELQNYDLSDITNVYTSFDPINYYIDELLLSYPIEEEISIVLIEPTTGYLRGIIGGKAYHTGYNRALKSKRQIGSTVKPFLYYKALESGFTPLTSFTSKQTVFYINGNKYAPTNYNRIYENKKITMAYALATSDNIYAVKTHLFIGMNKLYNLLNEINITETEIIPSLALGTTEATLLELTSAYNILASMGKSVPVSAIRYIETGNKVYTLNKKTKQVLKKDNVFILNELMTGIFDEQLSHNISVTGKSIAKQLTKKYAAKSGSTDHDSYMIGFNPTITLGIWAGHDDNRPSSATFVKIFWAKIMEKYTQDLPNAWFEPTANVEELLVNPSGLNTDYQKKLYFPKKYPLIGS